MRVSYYVNSRTNERCALLEGETTVVSLAEVRERMTPLKNDLADTLQALNWLDQQTGPPGILRTAWLGINARRVLLNDQLVDLKLVERGLETGK